MHIDSILIIASVVLFGVGDYLRKGAARYQYRPNLPASLFELAALVIGSFAFTLAGTSEHNSVFVVWG